MPKQTKVEDIVRRARVAADKIGADMLKVHGALWEGRENLAKIIISLSSTILVGTVTFSEGLLGNGDLVPICPNLLIFSWVLLFLSIVFGIYSLWKANTLKSFRIRFFNSVPSIEDEALQIDSNLTEEEREAQILNIVEKYSDASLEPLGSADKHANYSLNAALIIFALGLGLFLIYGAMQVT